jgi:outer membrane autotransporter protein
MTPGAQSKRIGVSGRRILRGFGIALALAGLVLTADRAAAQFVPPPQNDSPSATAAAGQISGQAALMDVGSHFLNRFGTNTWRSHNGASFPGSNPQGSGGPDPVMSERSRVWFEGYGLGSRTSAQGEFTGDTRKTWGGVAGVGYMLAPGASIGFSVDQSRTDADVNSLPQSSRIDLTQVGINGAIESGAWALAMAGVYGTGNIHSRRLDGSSFAEASYGVWILGFISELSYQISLGNSRIVPKAGFEYMQTNTDSYTEGGGAAPVSGIAQKAERSRGFAGAELGHTFQLERGLFDLAFTGKVINNFSQTGGQVTLSSTTAPAAPRLVQGAREGQWGFDAAAVASWIFAPGWKLYALYDGRFHDGFTSNGGTVGLEVKW